MSVIPHQKAPELKVQTVNHGEWDLSAQSPKNFSLITVYRGHHCPLCRKQLRELDQLAGEFEKIGVNVFAVSANSKELAEKAVDEWEIKNIPVGYELPLDQAREWNLYASKGVKDTEPSLFLEPGLFVIRPDQSVYAAVIQTMPFSRPTGEQLLSSLTYITENDYPSRGEAQY